ncbi:MAG: hypothetical protein ABIJ15_02745 [bacterium]
MKKVFFKSKKALVNMELSTFEIPPAGDILVLGKRCPIGPQAAQKMLNTVAAHRFELVRPRSRAIDGILIRKHLFLRADRASLVNTIIDETSAIMSEECMLSIKCEIKVRISREI